MYTVPQLLGLMPDECMISSEIWSYTWNSKNENEQKSQSSHMYCGKHFTLLLVLPKTNHRAIFWVLCWLSCFLLPIPQSFPRASSIDPKAQNFQPSTPQRLRLSYQAEHLTPHVALLRQNHCLMIPDYFLDVCLAVFYVCFRHMFAFHISREPFWSVTVNLSEYL